MRLLAGFAAFALLAAAQTPSPALLVLNKADAMLAIVDPVTNKVVARVPTGPNPHEVDVSADGKFAFASNYSSNTIAAIDLVAQKEQLVDLGELRRPHGIFFAGGKVYFTAEQNRMVGRYDPAAGKVDWTQSTNQESTHMVVVSKDLNKIFTSNIGSNTVSILERGTAVSVPVGPGPEAIDLSPDQKEIWTAHSGDGGVSIIDVAAKKVVQTLGKLTTRPNRLKFTPDGKRVLISDAGTGDLVVIDATARKEIKRIKVGTLAEGILITPDGARAYVALERDNAVAIVDLKTLQQTGRISTGNGPDGMAWAVRK